MSCCVEKKYACMLCETGVHISLRKLFDLAKFCPKSTFSAEQMARTQPFWFSKHFYKDVVNFNTKFLFEKYILPENVTKRRPTKVILFKVASILRQEIAKFCDGHSINAITGCWLLLKSDMIPNGNSPSSPAVLSFHVLRNKISHYRVRNKF